jgi:hypothetical protein
MHNHTYKGINSFHTICNLCKHVVIFIVLWNGLLLNSQLINVLKTHLVGLASLHRNEGVKLWQLKYMIKNIPEFDNWLQGFGKSPNCHSMCPG